MVYTETHFLQCTVSVSNTELQKGHLPRQNGEFCALGNVTFRNFAFYLFHKGTKKQLKHKILDRFPNPLPTDSLYDSNNTLNCQEKQCV